MIATAGGVDSIVERFAGLFKGGDQAHGVFEIIGKPEPGEKLDGRAYTVAEAPTPTHYKEHLDGKKGLGIIPIDRVALCFFAAIDIDKYGIDLKVLNRRCAELGLPLVVCRSKSGGAHLYLFFTNPADAARVRALLVRCAEALGYAGVEIFPKQEHLEANNVGNWINLPYFGADDTERYALGASGEKLTLAAFLDLAKARRVSIEDAEAIELPLVENQGGAKKVRGKKKTASERIHKKETAEGNRHNDLLTYLVAQKKKGVDPEDLKILAEARVGELWRDQLREGTREAKAMLKWIDRKVEADGEIFDRLVRRLTQPVTWILTVDGQPVTVETTALASYRLLNKEVIEQLGRTLPAMTDKSWRPILDALLAEAVVEEAAPEESDDGISWILIRDYLSGDRLRARTKDELLQGKPWHDDDAGRVYFILEKVKEQLARQHHLFLSGKKLGAIVRAHHADTTTQVLLGKHKGVWWVPFSEVEPAVQTEDFDVPRMDAEEI